MLFAPTLGCPARRRGKNVDVLGEHLVRDLTIRLGWRSEDGADQSHVQSSIQTSSYWLIPSSNRTVDCPELLIFKRNEAVQLSKG